jgi:hypothetical protein
MAVSGIAQQIPSKPEQITPASVRTVNAPFFPYFGESQCDENGNLFFHSGMSGYTQAQIFELSKDGDSGKLFKPSGKFAEDNAANFDALWIGQSGDVFIAVNGKGEYVLKFDRDGTMKDPIMLDIPEDTLLTAFAIFDNGSIFVAGNYGHKSPAHREGEGYEAILSSSGELIRELSIPVPDVNFEGGLSDGGLALSRGNLYFLGPDRITVISPSGQVIRKIPFDKPDRKSIATKIYASGGRIVIALNSPNKVGSDDRISRSFLVLDQSEGKVTGYYKPPDLNWSDVCLTPSLDLIFLTVENKQQRIVTATIR